MIKTNSHSTNQSPLLRGEGALTDAANFVTRKPGTGGFTLLELLIVLSILAIFLGLAVTGYSRYRWSLELRQAQQTFVQELNRARSEARRLSQSQRVTWTDKTVLLGEREIPLSESGAVTLVLIKGAKSLEYGAPYGTVRSTEYEFELRGRGNLSNKVYVYGVTGKVKAVP
jgi:prepilin-type N-terminal cleavage/methylation domain-containing protein